MSGQFKRAICTSTLRIAGAALLVGVLAPMTLSGATISGTCGPLKVRFINDASLRSTTSSTYVNLPGTAVSFTQGGTKNSCVVVDFSAEVASNYHVVIRPVLDNFTSAVPGESVLLYNVNTFQARGRSFIFPSVAPGKHIVRFQYHTSSNTANPGSLYDSNVIVHYAP